MEEYRRDTGSKHVPSLSKRTRKGLFDERNDGWIVTRGSGLGESKVFVHLRRERSEKEEEKRGNVLFA